VPCAVKGETIPIESGGGRKRLNVLGFLSREQGLVAYTAEGTVNSDLVIACFDALSATLNQKTVIVLDNSSFHTSSSFEAKIPEWKSKSLEIFYLPKYSPQLNLIEILWRFMKYEWIEWWAYKGWPYLVKYVETVICGYGTEYEINFV
jgi:transposase